MRWLPLVLLAAGCGGLSTEVAQADLWQANYNRWTRVGPASYDMVVRKVCECAANAMAVRVEVRNKTVTARIDLATGSPVPSALSGDFPDVPGLFVLIKQALDQHFFSHQANYDGTDGHPTQAFLNKDGSRVDDDVYYTISDFAAVTP